MYQQYRPARFNQLPVIVKNLLIINLLFFLAQLLFKHQFGQMAEGPPRDVLAEKLGLFFPLGDNFAFYQFITYQFLHGDFGHLFFNMLGLWFFGYQLENVWGPKRFLIFYLVCGLGAAAIHMGWTGVKVMHQTAPAREFLANPELGAFEELANTYTFPGESSYWIDARVDDVRTFAMVGQPEKALQAAVSMCSEYVSDRYNEHAIIGASGSVYGILMAFGLLFANTEIVLWGLFVPIRAKWLVLFLGISAFISAIANRPDDLIAHVAHLGGMVFGFILVKFYNRSRTHFY